MAKYRRKPVIVDVVPHLLRGKETVWNEITYQDGIKGLISNEKLARKYEPADTPTEVERLTALVEKMKVIICDLAVDQGCGCPCPSDYELEDLERCCDDNCKPRICWQAALDTANV